MQPQIGDTFGRLIAIGLEMRPRSDGKADHRYLLCRCTCGNTKYIRDSALRSGRVVSCGCYKAEIQGQRLMGNNGRNPQMKNHIERNARMSSTHAEYPTPDTIAHRRLILAFVELGACISDMGNLLLQGESPSRMKRGGIVMGLQRAMLATQNRSFAELQYEPQLEALESQSNHVYMDPIIDLINLVREFLAHVPDNIPLKNQVIEMLARIDTRTQVVIEQTNGIAIRSYVACSFTYKNWQGEIEPRRVRPVKFYYGITEWYPTPGWLMQALDLEKNQMRDFSMTNMTDVVFS